MDLIDSLVESNVDGDNNAVKNEVSEMAAID